MLQQNQGSVDFMGELTFAEEAQQQQQQNSDAQQQQQQPQQAKPGPPLGLLSARNSLPSDPRESVAYMAKAQAEAAGKVAGGSASSAAAGAAASSASPHRRSPTGGGSGGFSTGFGGGAGQAATLLDVSELDVLSVLFCLCPEQLDEMLEEVICGNMYRSLIPVSRSAASIPGRTGLALAAHARNRQQSKLVYSTHPALA